MLTADLYLGRSKILIDLIMVTRKIVGHKLNLQSPQRFYCKITKISINKNRYPTEIEFQATPPLSARPKCVLSSRSVQNPTIRSSWQLGTEGLPPGTKATLMADTKTVSER